MADVVITEAVRSPIGRRGGGLSTLHPADLLGANPKAGPGRAIPKSYCARYEFASQFEGAERIADKWGVTRSDADQFGATSQQRAGPARDEGWFEAESFAIHAPDVDEDGKPTGSTHLVAADEGP